MNEIQKEIMEKAWLFYQASFDGKYGFKGAGYAPRKWDALYKHLKESGYKDIDIHETDLVIHDIAANIRGKKYYDRFRNRIIFPKFDDKNNVINFYGIGDIPTVITIPHCGGDV
jgi:hypothetical protein